MDHNDYPDRKALMAAIELEEKGHIFFRDSASKAKNPLAREVFDYLAAEELNHLKAIKNFNENYLNGIDTNPDALIKGMISGKSPIQQLFDRLAEAAPVGGDDLDVYQFAVDFERRSELFYIKAEVEATDPSAKKLYGFLIGEERKHTKIVEACQAYFENPAEFFHQREKWHFEI